MNELNLGSLTEIFRKLGAENPESWARSQIEDGIPQLARFLFLRQAWSAVVGEDSTLWQTAAIKAAEKRPTEPYADVGFALKRLLAAGADPADLTEVVRGMQGELLFQFCYLLEDPGVSIPEVEGIQWALMQVDDAGQPIAHLVGLHESVLETVPGEMRPKPR